jgi:hypothetical protein
MLNYFGIYYDDQLLYSTSSTTKHTSTVWHNERLKAERYALIKLEVQEVEFDNSLYKVKYITATKEQHVADLLKGMKSSDIQLLKEYFKRDQA